jgi:glycosyltransferase involved in cell wall biosynthesis
VRAFRQVIVGAGPGDAITQMALEIRNDLRKVGSSEIFARFIDPAMGDEIKSLSDLSSGRPNDVVIYHSSYGDPEVTRVLLRRPERLVLVYHNVTPSEHFVHYDPAFAAGLEWGRRELSLLRDGVVLATADSRFNADELVQLGFRDVHVIAAGLRPHRLTTVTPCADTVRKLREEVGVPYVLNVSQLLPHKCQHVLIQALHVMQSVHGVEIGLVLVGPPRSHSYGRGLVELARRLRVRNLWLAHRQSDASLSTIYRSAHVFASASVHEGLGIPPLEAMSFGVPTVVRDAGATAETVAGGALVLPNDAGPLMFAEAILAAHQDEGLRSSMICAGLERIAGLTAAADGTSLVELLESAGLAS